MDWLQDLPQDLQNQIRAVIARDGTAVEAFNELYEFITSPKRRKVSDDDDEDDDSIDPSTIIFEIQQISIFSPIRKKMNLVFHLIEDSPSPVLSIVNPGTNIPELSILNLKESIKLCLILPILGNSTNPQKKGISLLCLWINDEQKDPIICQLNLDVIKKQMMKMNKLPANIDSQFDCPKDTVTLNPIQERIADYLKRQFKLCNVNLVNYLPSAMFKNNFLINNDTAVVIADDGKTKPSIIMVECHKGAKDGCLILLEENENPSYLIFAFKKPILVFEISRVLKASYSNVTSSTFNLNILVLNDRNEHRNIEFSMIDHKFFTYIDGFMKDHEISDDSYKKKEEEDEEEEDEDFKHESSVESVVEDDVFTKNTEAI